MSLRRPCTLFLLSRAPFVRAELKVAVLEREGFEVLDVLCKEVDKSTTLELQASKALQTIFEEVNIVIDTRVCAILEVSLPH